MHRKPKMLQEEATICCILRVGILARHQKTMNRSLPKRPNTQIRHNSTIEAATDANDNALRTRTGHMILDEANDGFHEAPK